MSDDLWRRMLAWAARARAKPSFDLEERDYRLAVADLTRAILEAVAAGEPVLERIEALAGYMRPRHELVVPRQMARLVEWAAENEAGVAAALRPFTDPAVPPAERLGRALEAGEAMPHPYHQGFPAGIRPV